MLKVECEACKAPYQVDERRVPPTGLKMRCPKCGHAFTVTNPNLPSAGAGPSAPPAASGKVPPLSAKHTMLGVAAPSAPPQAAASAPPAAAAGGLDDLPAKPAAKPPAKPPRPPPPAKPKAAPAIPAAPALGEIDELLDLPAMPDVGLPAPVKPLPVIKPTLVSQGNPPGAPAAAAKAAPLAIDDDLDLPSPVADLPAARGGAKGGGADLPSAKGPPARPGTRPLDFGSDLPSVSGGGADLPAAKGSDLPATKGPRQKPSPHADLPAPKDNIGLPAAFGDVGLPAARDVGLPAARDVGLPATRDVGLPAAFGDIDLPAPGGFGSIDFPAVGGSLPASVDQNQYLPKAAAPGAHLPSAVGGGSHLPAHLDALPSAMGGEMHLPSVQNALPAALGDANYLPSNTGGGDAAAPPGGFGEADFGDLGMPAQAAPSPAAGPKAVPGGQGGVGFGELDFGAGGDSAGVEADVIGREAEPVAEPGGEAALDEAPRPKAREKVVIDPRQGRLVKLGFAGVFALGVLGALLEFTHHGAFARHTIYDNMHKGQWTTEAGEAMAEARKTIGGDLYDKSRAAADGLAAKVEQNPRSQMLKAVAALAEYEGQERFGRDGARATRADGWLKAIEDLNGTPGSVPFYTAAAAGRAATGSDVAAARTALDAAAQKDTGDPIQADVALMRGELELRARDVAAANKAFTRALQVTPSAWGHYGLARAYFLAGDRAKVQSEIAATLAATPNHPGALILKATLAWADDRDDTAVIEALKPIIDGPAKTSASASELSRAYTLYGEAQASRGDVGAARMAFESALKLDATNGEALIGQGEVFFADGRYTEALSRFDTAVQADPSNPTAIVADAKAKIALERLSDAKTQLVAAQKAMPKNMSITYWLGKVEEKLGNKKGAEDAYVAAIGLTNPKDRDAIQPYVALSTLLAGQGRASEAADKLNEGRAKLPDSTAMQEALGQIAAAQGLFDDAITHYKNAVAKDPNDLRALFMMGDTYLRMRRLDDASAAFDKVEKLDKDYPSLAMRRGELLEASGHLDEALQQFKAAAERAPKDPDLQLRVGAAYVGIGRGEEALKVLKPVYDERQNSAEVNHYLGRAHLLLGGQAHLKEANRLLSKAVDIEPSRAEYHLYLAWVATESLDWKLAEVEVEKAIKLDQLLGDAYWQRAVIEEVKGNVDDAINDTQKALQLHPSRTEAHATLARCYADKNQPDKAIAEWAIATAHSERPDWEYLYGRLLYEKSGALAALPHVLQAAKAGQQMTPHPPWLGPVEFMTAEGLLKQGNKVDAKEHFLKFFDVGDVSSPDRKDAIRELKKLDPGWHPP